MLLLAVSESRRYRNRQFPPPLLKTDHFATLRQPRRPWLPAEALKETFHRQSATLHPDRSGETNAAAELNAAFTVLREPASRLRHLLELEHPAALEGRAEIPSALAETFLRLATLRRAVDAFLAQRSGAGSPLAQAMLAPEQAALERDVKRELAALEESAALGDEALEALDTAWETRTTEVVAAAVALQQELTYRAKWGWQLREALFRLAS